jgi:hypothetical protein
VEGTEREDCTEKSVVHQDMMNHYCLAGQKIPNEHTALVDRDVICNLHAKGQNESAEEGDAHRTRHRRNLNHVPEVGVLLLELLEVSQDAELERRFDPEMDVKASQ